MAGDTNKARSAYEHFFRSWENADPDIPILKQPKPSTRNCSRKYQGVYTQSDHLVKNQGLGSNLT